MHHINTDLGNTRWCLICSSAYPKVNLSSISPNSSTPIVNTDYDLNWLTKATEKIFQYLFIPKEHLINVKKKCLSFCPNCMKIVGEIIELQKKAEILELQIQWKVETLGKIANDTPAFTRISEKYHKETAEVWKSFKSHLTRNYFEGLLPNPSVRLGQGHTVNASASSMTVTELGKANSYHSSSLQESTTLKRKNLKHIETESRCETTSKEQSPPCIILKEDNKTETSGKIIKLERDDDDSNNKLFEVVTVPPIIVGKRKIRGDKSANQTFEISKNLKMTQDIDERPTETTSNNLKQHSSRDPCLLESNNCAFTGCKYTNREPGESILKSLLDEPEPVIPMDDSSYEEITVENKIWVGDTDQDVEEMNQTFAKGEESILTEQKNTEKISAGAIIFQQKMANQDIESIDNVLNSERQTGTLFEGLVQNVEVNTEGDECVIIGTSDSPTNQPNNDMLYEQVTVESELWLGDYEEVEEMNPSVTDRLETITSENNSSKVEEILPDQCVSEQLQIKTFETEPINSKIFIWKFGRPIPAKTNNISDKELCKTIDLTENEIEITDSECNFEPDSTNQGRKRKPGILETQTSTDNFKRIPTDGKVQKALEGLIEGRDYFKCTKCNFIAKQNSTSSYNHSVPKFCKSRPWVHRHRLANHYRVYHSPVKPTDKSKTIDGKDCYKCTKCTFSVVFQSETPNAYLTQLRNLSLHYMEVHDL